MMIVVTRRDADIHDMVDNAILIDIEGMANGWELPPHIKSYEYKLKALVKALEKYFNCQINGIVKQGFYEFEVAGKPYRANANISAKADSVWSVSASDFEMDGGSFVKKRGFHIWLDNVWEEKLFHIRTMPNAEERTTNRTDSYRIKDGDFVGNCAIRYVSHKDIIKYYFDELNIAEE